MHLAVRSHALRDTRGGRKVHMNLDQRTIVITGAAGGLGSFLAQEFAHKGSRLALIGRDEDKLQHLVQGLDAPADRIATWAVDLRDEAAAKATADAVVDRFGRVDALLHVVGGWAGGKSILDMPADDLGQMLDQHVWTSFVAARAFVPHLIAGGWGRIIMVTSPFASRPSAKGGAYAIAKAGQEALMLTLSQELKGTGVTANILQVKQIDMKRAKVSEPAQANAAWTTPEELAAAVTYLLSDAGAALNGAKLPMFGSYS